MTGHDRTIIIVDDDVDFTASDFMLAWNAAHSDDDLPTAAMLEKGSTFDGSLMAVVGDVANVLQIVGFVGVPTVAVIVQKILRTRRTKQSVHSEAEVPSEIGIDETVIDLDRDGRVRRITIRRQVG